MQANRAEDPESHAQTPGDIIHNEQNEYGVIPAMFPADKDVAKNGLASSEEPSESVEGSSNLFATLRPEQRVLEDCVRRVTAVANRGAAGGVETGKHGPGEGDVALVGEVCGSVGGPAGKLADVTSETEKEGQYIEVQTGCEL